MAFIEPNKLDPTQALVKGVQQPARPQVAATVAPAQPQPAIGAPRPNAAPQVQTMAAPAGGMAPAATRPNIGIGEAEDDSIGGRLAAITSQDSPVIQSARAQGTRAAFARGLGNSSVAVGAAQDAVYRVAAPLAAQEAGQAATRNNTRVQVAGQLAQIASQAGFDKEARADQFGYQKQLNAEQYAQERTRLELQLANANAQQKTEIEARLTMLDKEFQNQSKLSTQNFGQTQQLNTAQYQEQRKQLEMQFANANAQQKVEIQSKMDMLDKQFGQTQQLNAAQYTEQRKQLEMQFANANEQQKTEIAAKLQMLDKEFANQQALSSQNFGQSSQLQAQQIGAQMEQLNKQLASAEGQQKAAIEADLRKLQIAQTFNVEMAKMQQGYTVDNAKLQASLQSALQAQGNTEQLGRMAVEFSNQSALSLQQGKQALDQIAATGDQEMKRQAQALAASMQELTLKLNQQNTEAAAGAAMNLFNAEAQIRAALLSNTTIPAAERQSYMDAVSTLTGPTRQFINQLLGVQPPAPGGMAPGGATAPTGMAPTQPQGVTASGQPIYYAPSGGGTSVGSAANPYLNWQ